MSKKQESKETAKLKLELEKVKEEKNKYKMKYQDKVMILSNDLHELHKDYAIEIRKDFRAIDFINKARKSDNLDEIKENLEFAQKILTVTQL